MCVDCSAKDSGDSAPVTHTEREISSDLAELAGVRQFVRRVCDGSPLDEDATAQFELAMSETTSNIMRHAYKGRADGRIQILADTFSDRVVMRLYHWGIAFQPGPQKLPRVDTYQEGGYGLYIIERSVDEVRHSRDKDGRNCVLLAKYCRIG